MGVFANGSPHGLVTQFGKAVPLRPLEFDQATLEAAAELNPGILIGELSPETGT